jgi:hypothetical protein
MRHKGGPGCICKDKAEGFHRALRGGLHITTAFDMFAAASSKALKDFLDAMKSDLEVLYALRMWGSRTHTISVFDDRITVYRIADRVQVSLKPRVNGAGVVEVSCNIRSNDDGQEHGSIVVFTSEELIKWLKDNMHFKDSGYATHVDKAVASIKQQLEGLDIISRRRKLFFGNYVDKVGLISALHAMLSTEYDNSGEGSGALAPQVFMSEGVNIMDGANGLRMSDGARATIGIDVNSLSLKCTLGDKTVQFSSCAELLNWLRIRVPVPYRR